MCCFRSSSSDCCCFVFVNEKTSQLIIKKQATRG